MHFTHHMIYTYLKVGGIVRHSLWVDDGYGNLIQLPKRSEDAANYSFQWMREEI